MEVRIRARSRVCGWLRRDTHAISLRPGPALGRNAHGDRTFESGHGWPQGDARKASSRAHEHGSERRRDVCASLLFGRDGILKV
jgi:hypothetical protein